MNTAPQKITLTRFILPTLQNYYFVFKALWASPKPNLKVCLQNRNSFIIKKRDGNSLFLFPKISLVEFL